MNHSHIQDTRQSEHLTGQKVRETDGFEDAPSHPLLQLQRTLGNQVTGQIIQGKTDGPRKNNTGLPDGLKAGVENISGLSMDDVKVKYNSPEPSKINALAYTKGSDIHVAPGQEKHLPHEAWHVVQQKQGRVLPTSQMKSESINDSSVLEREADHMGAEAARTLPRSNESYKDLSGSRIPTARLNSDNSVIQRKMGFEIEIQVPVYPRRGLSNNLKKADISYQNTRLLGGYLEGSYEQKQPLKSEGSYVAETDWFGPYKDYIIEIRDLIVAGWNKKVQDQGLGEDQKMAQIDSQPNKAILELKTRYKPASYLIDEESENGEQYAREHIKLMRDRIREALEAQKKGVPLQPQSTSEAIGVPEKAMKTYVEKLDLEKEYSQRILEVVKKHKDMAIERMSKKLYVQQTVGYRPEAIATLYEYTAERTGLLFGRKNFPSHMMGTGITEAVDAVERLREDDTKGIGRYFNYLETRLGDDSPIAIKAVTGILYLLIS